MQKALDIANQQRNQTKESLNILLENPLATIAAPPQPNEEIAELKSQLRINELQLQSVCRMQIAKEQESTLR